MTENSISYILQIATILITLTLGLISVYQTRKIQHGQNIISVTTNYRLKRVEQLREFSCKLLTNTNPVLLQLDNNDKILQEACCAAEAISTVLHRHFNADRELIELAENIVELASVYCRLKDKSEKIYYELVYKRNVFKIKCDIYTAADWNRIKSETTGVNTSADSWIGYYNRINQGFEDELEKIKNEYDKAIKNVH